jgi:DNA-binding MarR family transcriptional regulator
MASAHFYGGVQPPEDAAPWITRYKATDEERRFLASVEGEPRRIWARRIARGLSETEREFINQKLGEAG